MKFLDSFCGAGGLCLGLIEAGLEPLLSFDIEEKCIETLQLNQKYIDHDVEKLDVKLLNGNDLLKRYNLDRGELFLLAGGPPCQGFSIQRIGDDKDPRNQLVYEYFRLVDELFPKYFLMENVGGILGARGKDIVEGVQYLSDKYGYHLNILKISAEDYGVPQRRKRVLFIGERMDLGEKNFKMIDPMTSEKNRVTVRDTIGNLPEPPSNFKDHPEIRNHRRDRLSPLNLRRIRAIIEGQGREDLPQELLAECHKRDSAIIGHRKVYGRMEWDKVSPTITARFDSFTRGQFGHPEQDRTISLREGALLQTFPIDYVFSGNKVEVARQIGNAVPRLLGLAIGKSILKSYYGKGKQK